MYFLNAVLYRYDFGINGAHSLKLTLVNCEEVTAEHDKSTFQTEPQVFRRTQQQSGIEIGDERVRDPQMFPNGRT